MADKPKIKDWLSAFRLRTLPLSFSSIITGSAIAHKEGVFNIVIFILALTTTLFLQILSNLANDYGDAEKGTDNAQRIGPQRAIQSGAISKSQMKKAIILFVILSLCSGLPLVFIATSSLTIWVPIAFVTLGLLAIVAAIKYTAGKGAYGYSGLGDLFVFIFFGLVGVIGSYLLYDFNFKSEIFFPAISIGLFSTAVLNLNNMRDIHNDRASGKNTFVVKIGLSNAKKYHFLILCVGILCALVFLFISGYGIQSLFICTSFIPLVLNIVKVLKVKSAKEFDPELKKVSLSTFMFAVLFWLVTLT